MNKLSSYFGCLLFGVFLCGPANAVVRYVDHEKTGGDKSGLDWANAYTSLSTALTNANSGDEVWVAEGTYGPIITVEFDGVRIYGGFSGGETSASESNPDTYITSITGEGTGRAIVSKDDSSATVIRGFHIVNGLNPADKYGAGVLLTDSSPTFVRCVFRDNTFTHVGGAVANIGTGSPRFVNCKFYHNQSVDPNGNGYAGAALYNPDGSPTLVNCLFYENTAMEAGAIASLRGVLTLINCTFADNKATYGNGGALYDYDGKAVIKNCIFWDNNSVKYDSDEIYNRYNTTTVTYSDIKGGWTGTGNINVNPKFVNPNADNYKIGGTVIDPSPCKDSGNDPSVPADFGDLDWDGDTTEQVPFDLSMDKDRFSWGGVDMGAYEWVFSGQQH